MTGGRTGLRVGLPTAAGAVLPTAVMLRPHRGLPALLALPLVCGCYGAAWRTATAGAAIDFARDLRPSGTVDLDVGGAIGGPLGFNANLHGRFSPDLIQVAPSLSARLVAVRRIPAFAGVGARALAFEWNRGAFGFGALSPYLEGGFFIFLDQRSVVLTDGSQTAGLGLTLVVQAQAGYDVRFTEQDNAFWGGVSVGLGSAGVLNVGPAERRPF